MTDITDVDEFTDPVVAPTALTALTAASVEEGLQDLANRTRNLVNRPQFGVNVQTFTADGTWTKPAGAVMTHIICVGSGASGEGDYAAGNRGGSGGSSGFKTEVRVPSSLLAATAAVVVGQSVAGGAAGSPYTGNDGEESSFTSNGFVVSAPGAHADNAGEGGIGYAFGRPGGSSAGSAGDDGGGYSNLEQTMLYQVFGGAYQAPPWVGGNGGTGGASGTTVGGGGGGGAGPYPSATQLAANGGGARGGGGGKGYGAGGGGGAQNGGGAAGGASAPGIVTVITEYVP